MGYIEEICKGQWIQITDNNCLVVANTQDQHNYEDVTAGMLRNLGEDTGFTTAHGMEAFVLVSGVQSKPTCISWTHT